MASAPKLNGKIVIITGGARGIGGATARIFAAEGAYVVVADLLVKEGENLAAEIQSNESSGSSSRRLPRAIFVCCDVTDRRSVQAVIDKTVEVFGRLDIMVCNAGVSSLTTTLKVQPAVVDRVFDVNIKGVYICGQLAAIQMLKQLPSSVPPLSDEKVLKTRVPRGGSILITSSVSALYGVHGLAAYAASKAAVASLAKTWAREFGPRGIRVNAVAPGMTVTDMIGGLPIVHYRREVNNIPLRSFAQAEDIAKAFLFLASDDSRCITGAILSVDGGYVPGTTAIPSKL